jgi:hypothetical protein
VRCFRRIRWVVAGRTAVAVLLALVVDRAYNVLVFDIFLYPAGHVDRVSCVAMILPFECAAGHW